MDVGFTKSNKSHPAHFIVGFIVVSVVWSATVFAVRPLIVRDRANDQTGAVVANRGSATSPQRELGVAYANRNAPARAQSQASAGG